MAHVRILRIHETAAILNHKSRAAELLDVRQRLQQSGGLGNQVLHRARIVRVTAARTQALPTSSA